MYQLFSWTDIGLKGVILNLFFLFFVNCVRHVLFLNLKNVLLQFKKRKVT